MINSDSSHLAQYWPERAQIARATKGWLFRTLLRVFYGQRAITSRVGRHLQRRGWLTRDAESSHLTLDREATALDSLLSH